MLAAGVAYEAALTGARQAEHTPLAGKTLAMIFGSPRPAPGVVRRPALRQLGGWNPDHCHRRGNAASAARDHRRHRAPCCPALRRSIMIRILNHDALLELAAYATVPVINGLTRRSHPCQVMADPDDVRGTSRPDRGRTIAMDRATDNNVLASWVAGERNGFIPVEASQNAAAARA